MLVDANVSRREAFRILRRQMARCWTAGRSWHPLIEKAEDGHEEDGLLGIQREPDGSAEREKKRSFLRSNRLRSFVNLKGGFHFRFQHEWKNFEEAGDSGSTFR